MLKKHHTLFFQLLLFVLLTSCFEPLFADDLEDAKGAYAAGQFEEAATLLGPLIRQNNMEAVYLLARMYEKGDGVNEDIMEAKRLFRLAATNGNSAAQQRLDVFDAQGADDSVVIDWYLPSANEGDTEAQYNLGFMYETGWGVRVNAKKAIRWYQEAAEAQHDVAQLRLGLMYIVGIAGNQSLDNGLSLLRRSAENGNRVAEALIQDLFDAGDVSLSNAVRVVKGIRRIIDEGEKETLQSLQQSLDLMHKNKNRSRKKIVKKTNTLVMLKKEMLTKPVVSAPVNNNSIVATKIEKIIAAANIELTHKTATKPTEIDNKQVKKHNKSRPTDTEKISDHELHKQKRDLFNWYLKRAKQGEADSQYQLGAMYVRGQQVEIDVEEGVRWIGIAAKQGFNLAETYMDLWAEKPAESSIAVDWLKDAGRNFDIDAIFNLAFIYETGRGVQVNTWLAKQWYELAAAEGHAEAKKRFSLMKVNQDSDGNNAISPALKIKLNFPLMIGLSLVLFVGIFVFIFFRRNEEQSVSIPPLDGMNVYKVSHDKEATRKIPAEDRNFIDDLWSSPNSNQNVDVHIPSFESSNPTDKLTEKVEEKDNSPELSAVDKKLSDAIDMLMGMKSADSADNNSEIPPKPIVDDEKRLKLSDGQEKSKDLDDEKRLKLSDDQEKSKDLVEEKNDSDMEKLNKKVIENFKVSSDHDADKFLSDGISLDELATSRVSADSFFADGISIEEAVKTMAYQNQRHKPKKLTANEMLQIENVSSKNLNNKKSISKPSGKVKNNRKKLVKKQDELPNFGESIIPTPEKEVKKEKDIKKDKSIVKANSPRKVNISQQIIDIVEPIYPSKNTEDRALSEVHYNIGVMFSSGDGVPQNDAQAAKWFLKAAEEDMPPAQFSIGQCYLTGAGVQKNTAIAMDWIQKAADNNYKPALDELQKKNKAS